MSLVLKSKNAHSIIGVNNKNIEDKHDTILSLFFPSNSFLRPKIK